MVTAHRLDRRRPQSDADQVRRILGGYRQIYVIGDGAEKPQQIGFLDVPCRG